MGLALTSSATGCSLTRSLSDLTEGDADELNHVGDSNASNDGSTSGPNGPDGPGLDGGGNDAGGGQDAEAGAGTCAYRDCVLADEPAAYWRFGEASSAASAVDESGHGHDATYAASVTYSVPGAIVGDSNTAVHFDGSQGLSVGDVFRFDGTSPFSLEAWVKPALTSGFSVLLARDSDPDGYALYFASNVATFERIKSGDSKVIEGASVSTSKYNHIVAIFDGSLLHLYVNGAAVASGPSTSSIPGASTNFYIATDRPSSGHEYEGDMDEAAVYDHALTAERVLVHYQAGSGTNE